MLVIHFINVLQNVKMLNRRSDCLQQFHCSKGHTYGYGTEKNKSSPVFFLENWRLVVKLEREALKLCSGWMLNWLTKDCDHEVKVLILVFCGNRNLVNFRGYDYLISFIKYSKYIRNLTHDLCATNIWWNI